MLITVNKVLINVGDSTYVKPWSEMISNGQKWSVMVSNDQKWSVMVRNGQKYTIRF